MPHHHCWGTGTSRVSFSSPETRDFGAVLTTAWPYLAAVQRGSGPAVRGEQQGIAMLLQWAGLPEGLVWSPLTTDLNLIDWSSQNFLAVALDNSVYLWNYASGEIIQLLQMENPDDYVSAVSWIKEGNYLAIGTSNAEVQVRGRGCCSGCSCPGITLLLWACAAWSAQSSVLSGWRSAGVGPVLHRTRVKGSISLGGGAFPLSTSKGSLEPCCTSFRPGAHG